MPVFNGNNTLSDTIVGSAGNDTIYGYDSASGSLGAANDGDSLNGGAGNDSILGGNGNDTINGGVGDDVISGGNGNDSINGGDGGDTLNGDDGNDLIFTGDTTLSYTPKFAYGGNGDDTIIAGSGIIFNYGGAGNDLIDVSGETSPYTAGAYGGDGNDTLIGGVGSDFLDCGTGADSVLAGAGDDYVYSLGANGADILDGGSGIDYLSIDRTGFALAINVDLSNPATQLTLADGTKITGFEYIDFTSGSGNDSIIASNRALPPGFLSSQNIVRGGDGNDTLVASSNGAQLFGGNGNDSLRGSGELHGDVGDDIITLTDIGSFAEGGAGNDTITGGAGNDTIYGDSAGLLGFGANVINAGGGDDSVYSWHGSGPDTLDGGAGNDFVAIDRTDNTLAMNLDFSNSAVLHTLNEGTNFINFETVNFFSGTGNDTLVASNGVGGGSVLSGGAGNDSLIAGSNGATLSGDAGDDTLVAGGGVDFASGGAGTDIFVLNYGTKTTSFTMGPDIFGALAITDLSGTSASFSQIESFNATFGSGSDFVILGTGDDTVNGGAGNDTLITQTGSATIDGGAGIDTWGADFSTNGAATSINLNLGGVQTTGNGSTYSNIEALQVFGSSLADTFLASTTVAASDFLFGGGGNDTLSGGAGADSVSGGDGNDGFVASGALDGADTYAGSLGVDIYADRGADTLDYTSLGAANGLAVILNPIGTTTVIITGGDNDLISQIENITGGAGNDYIAGDYFNNLLVGGAGSDALIGNYGADTLIGGNGNDYLYMDHLDSINGGAGYDAVYVQDATGVNLNVGAAQAEYVYAYTGNDTLNASTSTVGVTLIGEAGVDVISGSAFNDYVYFDGFDFINAGNGYDALFYYQGAGQALANLNLNVAAANAEYVIAGGGNDNLFANTSTVAVALIGGAGNDTLTGGNGSDYLYGDSGAGNIGNDVFVVTLGAQTDVALDFANGADRLNVHATGLTTFAQVQAAASAYGPGSTLLDFGGGNKMVLYNFALGNLDASDIIF